MTRSAASLAACAVLITALPAIALTPALPPSKPTRSRARATEDHAQSLPVRRISLYKNGVGFFEHIGTVSGSERVTIDFTTAQLNDVLQTLTAVDLGGGRIIGAGYNSTTPLDQQLKSLPLSLSSNPTAADFYQAIRGARVEVTGAGATTTGRILNIELRATTPPRNNDNSTPPEQRHVLTVISDSGAVRSIELNSNTSVRLLDPDLHGDVNRYLQVLAANHQDGLRHLTLVDNGSGTRELRVSYISEVPIWKSTYRILFDHKPAASGESETATLQGWAVVDNTVGTDWDNVQLSLIAGNPQSFLQPISQPYYSRRPEIGLPEEAQLAPQTHESGDSGVTRADTPPPPAPTMASMATDAAIVSEGHGIAGGSSPVNGRTLKTYARLASPPIAYEDSASASIKPNTQTSSFDDYFEYKIADPITIRKNESALVPILQTKINVDRVTLWSPSQPQALRALWITNISNLTFDRGSFSIIESGNFGGQGLLDPVHPGEKRLLSYAADQAVHVSDDNIPHNSRRLQQIVVAHGILTEKTLEVAEREYLVHNAAPETRTVIVEHPRHSGWDLDSDPKPTETTPSLYRFRVVTQSNETVRLHVGERHTLSTTYQLTDMNEQQIDVLIRTNGDQAGLREKLTPILESKHHLAEIDSQIGSRQQQINGIGEDQKRLRDNLSALKGSSEERALIKRYTAELNQQEDRITALKKEIDALQQQRTAAEADLANRIESLQMEVSL